LYARRDHVLTVDELQIRLARDALERLLERSLIELEGYRLVERGRKGLELRQRYGLLLRRGRPLRGPADR